MQIKYACAKRTCSKRIPERGPGQSSGLESAALEFTSERYRMHVAGAVLVVKPLATKGNESGDAFCYPLTDFEYLIQAEEQQGKR